MAWLVTLHAAGGLVLVLAGLGKLRSPDPVAEALRSLHLPSGQVAIGLLAGAEVVIGVAGALAGGSWFAWVVAAEWAALAAVALLLRTRPRVPCGCFGAPDEPAGVAHVVVDLAFAGVAVATAIAADDSLADAADDARGGWVGIGVAAVLLAIAVRRLLAGPSDKTEAAAPTPDAIGTPAQRVEPAAVTPVATASAPAVGHRVLRGVTPDGRPVEIALSGHHRPTLLAFLTDTCVTCRAFWTAFAEGTRPPGVDVVVVTMGPEDDSAETIAQLAPRTIPTVMSSDAWDELGVAAGPYFVLLDAAGAVRTHGPASTWASLETLLGA